MLASVRKSRPIDILLIEDNLGDIELAIEALSEGKVANNLHIARDGEEAIAFLKRGGGYSAERLPDLILLDLNLPKQDGRAVLDKVKQDPMLRMIPIIVLTSSEEERDITMCYMLHANCYIVKPADFTKYTHVVEAIEQFWLGTVRLP